MSNKINIRFSGCASDDAKYLQMSRSFRKLFWKNLLESDPFYGQVNYSKSLYLKTSKKTLSFELVNNNHFYFRVSNKLKDLYSESIQVPGPRLLARDLSINTVVRHPHAVQMVYVDQSYNFCEKNNREGSQGTRGR